MRAHTGLSAALTLAAGITALAAPAAVAAPTIARADLHHITGTAGNSGQLHCGLTTRTKGLPGNITMMLNQAPAGQLLVRLQNAKNGAFFGEQKVLNTGTATTTLVNDVLAGTQFHVCAASPTGSPSGPYTADLSY